MDVLGPESWASLPGYEGLYEVSSLGLVRSLGTGKLVAQRWHPTTKPENHRYLTVRLRGEDGKRKWMKVHKAVLLAFVSLCPPGLEGCHWDGDRSNNSLSNLRWDTRQYNALDALVHGTHSETRKTVCPADHRYSPENTRYTPRGHRVCRACHRERERSRRAA